MTSNTQPQESNILSEALYTYALRLTNNPYQAKRLIRDTISSIEKRASSYTPTLSFLAWAKMLMKNIFINTYKDADLKVLRHLAFRGMLNPIQPDSDREYTLREQIKMMSRLTPQQAAAATLRINGYTHDIIAHHMGITKDQVKTILAQARYTLSHAWDS